jgi:phage tail sheath protein FI
MATSYSYPGVYVQELQSASHPITGVPTSITAFVGYTKSGIDNRAQMIFSFSDYERLYGGLASNSELSYAVQQFFQNGGAQAYVVRTPAAGGKPAKVSFQSFNFEALSSGTAADGNLLIDIDYIGLDPASTPKTFNLTVTDLAGGTTEYFPAVSYDNTQSNWVQTAVNDPDNGSQLITMQAPTAGELASISALASIAQTGLVGSAVTAYDIATALCKASAPVSGTAAVTQKSSQVAGTNTHFSSELQVGQWVTFGADPTPYRILAISNDKLLTLTQSYAGTTQATAAIAAINLAPAQDYTLTLSASKPSPQPSGLPITVKIFASGVPLPATLSGIAGQIQQAFNTALAVQIPGASMQVTVTQLPGSQAQALRVTTLLPGNPDAVINFDALPTDCAVALKLQGVTGNVAHYALGTTNLWGDQSNSDAGSDGTGLSGTSDLIGDQADFSGIYALQKVDLFNLLCIPDATRASKGDPSVLDSNVDPGAIWSAAIALCDLRRAFLLIDPPPNVNNVSGAMDWKSTNLGVVNANGAAFFPRLRLPDPLNQYQLRTFAPCGVVAGVYATTDGSRGVWKAPAGTTAVLNGVQSMVYKLNDMENGVLNPLGLNCFRNFPVYGSVLWGARTLVGADAMTNQWKYVPVRRTALYIEESLYRGTQWVVFEPNDEPLWASIRLNVGAFMQSLFLKGAFQGSTPKQAYFVKCDGETTTQADIDNGVVGRLCAAETRGVRGDPDRADCRADVFMKRHIPHGVIPAKAGIHFDFCRRANWIPAFAGMTAKRAASITEKFELMPFRR